MDTMCRMCMKKDDCGQMLAKEDNRTYWFTCFRVHGERLSFNELAPVMIFI